MPSRGDRTIPNSINPLPEAMVCPPPFAGLPVRHDKNALNLASLSHVALDKRLALLAQRELLGNPQNAGLVLPEHVQIPVALKDQFAAAMLLGKPGSA
jgi:hypothetical protein